MSLKLKKYFAFILRATVLTATAALLSLGSTVSAVAQDLTPVSFRLDWLPRGYHAPIFLALERGYFTEAGLNLTLEDGTGSNPALQAVSARNNDIAMAGYTALIQGIPTGLDVLAIGGLVQVSPDSIVSLAKAPISKPEDMIGKTIAGNTSSASAKGFEAFMRATGIDASQVTFLNTAAGANAPAVLSGNADGMTGWAITDAVGLATQAEIAPPLLLADYGVKSLGMGFITSNAYAKANPEVLKKFMGAVARGYAEGFADPEAAIDALIKARPLTERDLQLTSLKLLSGYTQTEFSKGKPFGWTAKEDWDATEKLLRDFFEFTAELDISTVYSNDFVPAE